MKKILYTITLLLFFISFLKISFYIYNHFKNKNIENITYEYIVPVKESDYLVNFNRLKSLNNDSVGYLIINGINLKYVVLKSNNNKYYLNHNFNKEYSGSGWIFMDYRNRLDGTDKNIVIYGHNMKDNSMFGKLRNILKKSFRKKEDNLIINLIREDGIHNYIIFSSYIVDSEDYYTTTSFQSDIEFQLFLDVIKYRSIYDYKVSVDSSDNIITLSTCYSNTNKRVVIHAKEIDF